MAEESTTPKPEVKSEDFQEASSSTNQNFGGRNPRFTRPPRRGGGRGGGGGGRGPDYNRNSRFNRRPHDDNFSNPDDQNDYRENRFQDKLNEKLAALSGPTTDLPPVDTSEKKFSGRNRLYIGNLSHEITEDDLKENLEKCGEITDLFLNKDKGFAFVKFDYYSNAEKAKRELDGTLLKGKPLKVRVAPNNSTIKVKNLPNFISNELLFYAFSVFGEVERALVMVDERGKAIGEGIIEFARKGSALSAVKKCSDRCFFLTESLRPCIVESYEFVNDTDGVPEKLLPKRNPDFIKLRSKGPRLAETNSFEHDYGVRWKQLLELHDQKQEALKKELQMETEKLEAQMEYARYEHETELLRQQLRVREMDKERQKQEWEMKERQVEEEKRRAEEMIRRKQESLQARMFLQEDEIRRRQQENDLYLQAHELHSMLEQQEQSFEKPEPLIKDNILQDAPTDLMTREVANDRFQEPDRFLERDRYQEQNFNRDGFNGRDMGWSGGSGRDRWVTDRRDDFQSKRRRF